MSESLTRCEIADGVARLVLNRPQKRNALTRQLLTELLDAVRRVEADASVRVLLLEAEGPVFCAGMDLGEMQARATQPDAAEQWQEDTRVYRDLVERLFRLPMPTLAVVQGPVLAGGVGLVLACDLVLASTAASFSLPEPRRGITAAVVTPLLNLRIGPGAAGYLLLSGQTLPAGDALRMGLCHELVVPDESLASRRDVLVQAILAGAPSALTLTKSTLQRCAAEDLSRQFDFATEVSAKARETEAAREGLAAFLEKRPPRWAP
jgi:methylglutaconyl-CoA hydratase